ncbi:RNA cap guanine-N2 methyltransferase-domain-containing protein [Podospora australis]|uniref:Trimethylguanosine synthase n=1 Tax=Podospora australis TaxID=1536484 RepID=A0AAN7AGA8_9PEZI|nr:RNA cap guanine-N2 methyltransferase-domain-containing protein [Podospora australis]
MPRFKTRREHSADGQWRDWPEFTNTDEPEGTSQSPEIQNISQENAGFHEHDLDESETELPTARRQKSKKLASNSKKPLMRPVTTKLPLTDKCLHFDDISEVPGDLQKYYHQRYSIFRYYDYDVRLTHDAWFGVTPEPVAIQVAQDISSSLFSTPLKDTIVDLFGGAGGNSIAFALSEKWSRVIAIEKDTDTLACAMHNAEVYGVQDYITFIHGDCLDFLDRLKTATETLDDSLRLDPQSTMLFASPPWGGVNYRDQDVFDLSTMEPYNLEVLHQACKPMEHALYLPRTSDLRQIAKLVPDGTKIDVRQYCMEGASKALVAFLPASFD